MLDKTMAPIWPKNVRALIMSSAQPMAVKSRNVCRDLLFFEHMLTDRNARYEERDQVTNSACKVMNERKRKRDVYYENQRSAKAELFSTESEVQNDTSTFNESDDEMFTPTTTPSPAKKAYSVGAKARLLQRYEVGCCHG